MLRIYWRMWQVNWSEQWQYRANLLMYLLYWLVSPIVYLSVWSTVARGQGQVGGLTPNDFVTYYLTLLIVDNLASDITIHLLAYKIQDGTLSGDLLKPVHPILTNTLMNNLAFKALMLMVLVPVWLLLCLLFQPDFSGVTPMSLLLAAPAIALAFGISFLFGAAITCVAFWTTRVYSLHEFYMALMILFAGQFVPLDLMPPMIQRIAQFLPFQLLRYFPIQLILGKLPPDVIVRDFALAAVWFAIALGLFQLVWRSGVKRFSAVGA
ncbi:MAG TPA: ABC-2 family transporter protein [Kouleothrix sp.]|uniref:ABC transporter permease n=1 Tax=Kouleothrix sp. TaxID=2779161 RepID=UPI002CDDB9F3|nr:ABC-2 family transporter protein [Kouleothrix sp.]HRC74971.1 ABC-2 family transporter protein [Kouleothrix sp.]